MRRLRKATSRSRRRQSQILTVSSLDADARNAPLPATVSRLTAFLCSARCMTIRPRGRQGAELLAGMWVGRCVWMAASIALLTDALRDAGGVRKASACSH